MDLSRLFYAGLDVQQHPEGISEQEAIRLHTETGAGACDEMFVAAIAFKGSQAFSTTFYSFTPNSRMSDDDYFRIWAFMARALTRFDMSESKRKVCDLIWQHWTEKYRAPRAPCTHEGGRIFHITYRSEKRPEGMTFEEVARRKLCAADAFIIGFIKYPNQGIEFGEVGEPLSDKNWWDIWIILAHHLCESTTILPEKQIVAKFVINFYKPVTN